jgi:hypothetical protein
MIRPEYNPVSNPFNWFKSTVISKSLRADSAAEFQQLRILQQAVDECIILGRLVC